MLESGLIVAVNVILWVVAPNPLSMFSSNICWVYLDAQNLPLEIEESKLLTTRNTFEAIKPTSINFVLYAYAGFVLTEACYIRSWPAGFCFCHPVGDKRLGKYHLPCLGSHHFPN